MLSKRVKLDSLIDWNQDNFLRMYIFIFLNTKKLMQIQNIRSTQKLVGAINKTFTKARQI